MRRRLAVLKIDAGESLEYPSSHPHTRGSNREEVYPHPSDSFWATKRRRGNTRLWCKCASRDACSSQKGTVRYQVLRKHGNNTCTVHRRKTLAEKSPRPVDRLQPFRPPPARPSLSRAAWTPSLLAPTVDVSCAWRFMRLVSEQSTLGRV